MAGTDALKHLEPVEAGHHDIEKDEVEFLSRDKLESRKSVFGLFYQIPAFAKSPTKQRTIVVEVIDDQQSKGIFVFLHRTSASYNARNNGRAKELINNFKSLPVPCVHF
jgi:hypothetical protein